ncbi:MAG: nuclear transport factor 2 family protein [Oscillatoria princeps RMCB-10]|jgi:ketosteroid isomerase-like protein|nr:nuclear transport factor 2 family protein [Oscillatoria princeps RMCB-10]
MKVELDNTDKVRELYATFGRGDIEGFLNLCQEDIEWTVYGPPHLEKSDRFIGHEGVLKFLNILTEQFDYLHFDPQQYILQGDTVVVLGWERCRFKNTGQEFENFWAHAFDFNGELIYRFREYLCHRPIEA